MAIYYGDRSGFTGVAQARGGVSQAYLNDSRFAMANGGAGTVYWKQASQTEGELVIDNGGVPSDA